MEMKKNIGIWMDHSFAHLIELSDSSIKTNIIESEFTHEDKEHSLAKSENLMHNKENHLHLAYYKKITAEIRNYQAILLFGPTTAKKELANLLKADHHFANVKIDVVQTDKMNDNQKHAFVKEHFNIN